MASRLDGQLPCPIQSNSLRLIIYCDWQQHVTGHEASWKHVKLLEKVLHMGVETDFLFLKKNVKKVELVVFLDLSRKVYWFI